MARQEGMLAVPSALQENREKLLKTLDLQVVSSPSNLKISDDPEIKKIWDRIQGDHIKGFLFLKRIIKLSHLKGPFWKFSNSDWKELEELIDYQYFQNENIYKYFLGYLLQEIYSFEFMYEAKRYNTHFSFLFVLILQKYQIPFNMITQAANQVFFSSAFDEYLNEKLFIYIGRDSRYDSEFTAIVKFANKVEELMRKKEGIPHEFYKVLYQFYQDEKIPFTHVAPLIYGCDSRGNLLLPKIKLLKSYQNLFESLSNKEGIRFVDSPHAFFSSLPCAHRDDLLDDKMGPIRSMPTFLGIPLRLPEEEKTKVRVLDLDHGERFFIKRVNPLRVRYPEEEIELAEQVNHAFTKLSVKAKAQEFIGIVFDQGNFYLISKQASGESLLFGNSDEKDEEIFFEISDLLDSIPLAHSSGNLRKKEIFRSQRADGSREYTVLDLESHPFLDLDWHQISKASQTNEGWLAEISRQAKIFQTSLDSSL